MNLPDAILAGYDWGGRAACIVAALWPERVKGLVTCGKPYNIQNIAEGGRPAAPESERRSWYVYYLNTARGRAGLSENRRALCRTIWQSFSPTWPFDDATYERSLASFDNPDFVDVVVHSYRHRLGAVAGDPALEPIEQRLALQPSIEVPTILLSGADDGVEPPDARENVAGHFPQLIYRSILDGVGHNVPQEAPTAFADAVLRLR
jgi:pimeloyl-ACP methyl ester carboxylesterase